MALPFLVGTGAALSYMGNPTDPNQGHLIFKQKPGSSATGGQSSSGDKMEVPYSYPKGLPPPPWNGSFYNPDGTPKTKSFSRKSSSTAAADHRGLIPLFATKRYSRSRKFSRNTKKRPNFRLKKKKLYKRKSTRRY